MEALNADGEGKQFFLSLACLVLGQKFYRYVKILHKVVKEKTRNRLQLSRVLYIKRSCELCLINIRKHLQLVFGCKGIY